MHFQSRGSDHDDAIINDLTTCTLDTCIFNLLVVINDAVMRGLGRWLWSLCVKAHTLSLSISLQIFPKALPPYEVFI